MDKFVIRNDAPRGFLCLAGVIHRDDIVERIQALLARFSQLSEAVPNLGSQIALYHPQGEDPFGPDGEPFWIGRELTVPFNAPAGLQLNWTPGGDVAVLAHRGPLHQLFNTHLAIHREVAKQGRRLVGPNWERYTPSGSDPAQLDVEVCYLLEQER